MDVDAPSVSVIFESGCASAVLKSHIREIGGSGGLDLKDPIQACAVNDRRSGAGSADRWRTHDQDRPEPEYVGPGGDREHAAPRGVDRFDRRAERADTRWRGHASRIGRGAEMLVRRAVDAERGSGTCAGRHEEDRENQADSTQRPSDAEASRPKAFGNTADTMRSPGLTQRRHRASHQSHDRVSTVNASSSTRSRRPVGRAANRARLTSASHMTSGYLFAHRNAVHPWIVSV